MNKSPPRTFKIMNTFTEDECKYIQKKMKGYDVEIKYNSFHEINKKYLTQQTKQELYDTCVAQKKQIEELKKNKKSDGVFSEEDMEEEIDRLKKCVKEREDYIKDIEDIVRKLDNIMNEQKKTIEDLNLINDGLSEQVEEYEEELEKVNILEEQVEKLQEQIKTYEEDWDMMTEKIEKNTKKSYEEQLKQKDRYIETLKKEVKKWDFICKFLDEEEVDKSVKEDEKKVVKKKVKSKEDIYKNYNEMNDILKKYS